MLARDSSGPRAIRSGTVEGVHVMRYRVTLDLAKAAKEPGVTGEQSPSTTTATCAIDEHVHLEGRVSFRITRLGGQAAIEAPVDEVFDVTEQIPTS